MADAAAREVPVRRGLALRRFPPPPGGMAHLPAGRVRPRAPAAAAGRAGAGTIRVGEVSTPAPSPFCGELLWKQTNTLMYADDAPPGAGGTASAASLSASCAFRGSASAARRRRHGRLPGQAPADRGGICPPGFARAPGLGEGAGGPAPRGVGSAPRRPARATTGHVARELLEEELRGKIVERPLGRRGLPCVTARGRRSRVE